ncbi:DUF6113 family protein [Saccharothrix sp. ST-888]|uniref:DUF6113 family protein n=1 Tax=Saccharothrix sp. ST-888 TaxID=1427391 RepID=UPI000B0C555C|nr:DUF6113 family protein [Saccharothrix sp. ST-888]
MSTPPKSSPAKSPAVRRRSLPVRVLGTQAERLAEPQPPRAWRIVAYVFLFVLGLLVSLCGCFVQALWPPFGMLLAVAASLGLFYGGLRLTGTKLGAGVPLGGWFLMLLVLMSPRPEGDFVLSADLTSYAYLFLGAVGGVICATLPTRGGFGFGAAGPRR